MKYPQDAIVPGLLRCIAGGEACLALPKEMTPDEEGRLRAFLDGIPGIEYALHGWALSISLRKEEVSLDFLKP